MLASRGVVAKQNRRLLWKGRIAAEAFNKTGFVTMDECVVCYLSDRDCFVGGSVVDKEKWKWEWELHYMLQSTLLIVVGTTSSDI